MRDCTTLKPVRSGTMKDGRRSFSCTKAPANHAVSWLQPGKKFEASSKLHLCWSFARLRERPCPCKSYGAHSCRSVDCSLCWAPGGSDRSALPGSAPKACT